MTPYPQSLPLTHHVSPGRSSRWLVVLGLSVLLHACLLRLVDGGIGISGAVAPPRVIQTDLSVSLAIRPEVPPAPEAAKPEPVSRPAAPSRKRSRPAAVATVTPPPTPAATMTPDGTTAPTAAVLSDAADADAALPATSESPATAATLPDPPDAVTAPIADRATPPVSAASPATPASARYTVSLPPSAALDYEVRYTTRGNITRGSSVIDWRNDGGRYAIHGEVTKFGFTLSSFRSEGGIDDAGIAPDLYAEKNARRSETNTHFSRDARQSISFSASTDAFPLTAGSQDRASILWQLSGIGRGDRAAFVPGAVLDVFVAGVRDAEHWLIQVVGEETVQLENGEARTWHLVRAPRAGTYDKRLDIWLAPERQWYPVKLRYTEVSGDTLDLSLAAIRNPKAP